MAQSSQLSGSTGKRGARMPPMLNQDMQECVDNCLNCHSVCLAMASQHRLERGGEHVEPQHFRLMLACAEICRSAAAVMMIGTDMHARLCALCADICDECARSCEQLGDMERCVEACRRCAEA